MFAGPDSSKETPTLDHRNALLDDKHVALVSPTQMKGHRKRKIRWRKWENDALLIGDLLAEIWQKCSQFLYNPGVNFLVLIVK